MIITPEINWLAILPELVLAVGAAAVLLVEVQWKPRPTVLGAITAWVLALAVGITVVQWDHALARAEPGMRTELIAFSGMVVVDGIAVFGRLILLTVTALGLVAGWRFVVSLGRRQAEAIALMLLATTGFSIMIASNNLILMFLGLEVGSIAFYVLAGLTTGRRGADEAAMKYFLLGSFASAILVYGVALLYAGTGQFEILAIEEFFARFVVTRPAVILAGIALITVGLAFKVSAAPFHSWAPDVYQGAPAGVVGYMAAMAKVAGFIVLVRVLVQGLAEYSISWSPMVAAMAALSMVVGSVLALVQDDVRRVLAYSGVAHAGFLMAGVVGGGATNIIFYLVVYAAQLLGAFAVVSAVSGPASSGSPMVGFRGLTRGNPALAHGFTAILIGMAGIPVTAGFVAKFGVLSDAWVAGFEWLVYVGVLSAVIGLAAYLRLIVTMYMEQGDGPVPAVTRGIGLVVGVAVVVTILFGILPGILLDIAGHAFIL
jgi:NADH-quinone oxidoreductase subunit N